MDRLSGGTGRQVLSGRLCPKGQESDGARQTTVAVIMGSASDSEVMKGCVELLRELELPHEVKVLSAHRTPDLTRAYAVSAADRGIEVIIAGAGWAAHLAGAIAAHTTLPVIGVPVEPSPFKGLDHEESNRR
jgi:phosphoribosylaminoimidazole carboxylase PurE protein